MILDCSQGFETEVFFFAPEIYGLIIKGVEESLLLFNRKLNDVFRTSNFATQSTLYMIVWPAQVKHNFLAMFLFYFTGI